MRPTISIVREAGAHYVHSFYLRNLSGVTGEGHASCCGSLAACSPVSMPTESGATCAGSRNTSQRPGVRRHGSVLAYVFSHRAGRGVDVVDYEEALRSFHSALASTPPRGFVYSNTFRIGDVYSDWYLIESSAALDTLDEAAVTGTRAAPHDAAARMATDGVGKLYSLVAGEPLSATSFEMRFGKPAGWRYAELYAWLQSLSNRRGSSLWRRRIVCRNTISVNSIRPPTHTRGVTHRGGRCGRSCRPLAAELRSRQAVGMTVRVLGAGALGGSGPGTP